MSITGPDPYEALASAVVMQTVRDYRAAVKKLKRNRRNADARQMKEECERFFLSEHFNTFTEIDGRMLLSRLRREVSEE